MKYKTEILTGLGITGMIFSVLLAIKATPKAMKKMEKRKEELGVEKLPVLEVVKTAGPCYLSTATCMVASSIAIIKNTSDLTKANANLATGLILSEEAHRVFEDKAKEVIGEKKVNDIRDEIAREQLSKHPVGNSEVVVTGRGKSLVFDDLTKRYFEYDIDELKRVELNAKRQTVDFMFVSVNEWLSMLGLKPLHATFDELGWGPNTGFEIYYSYQPADDGRPCCVINYLSPPRPRKEAN